MKPPRLVRRHRPQIRPTELGDQVEQKAVQRFCRQLTTTEGCRDEPLLPKFLLLSVYCLSGPVAIQLAVTTWRE